MYSSLYFVIAISLEADVQGLRVALSVHSRERRPDAASRCAFKHLACQAMVSPEFGRRPLRHRNKFVSAAFEKRISRKTDAHIVVMRIFSGRYTEQPLSKALY
jgi:hypothetical protein